MEILEEDRNKITIEWINENFGSIDEYREHLIGIAQQAVSLPDWMVKSYVETFLVKLGLIEMPDNEPIIPELRDTCTEDADYNEVCVQESTETRVEEVQA